MGLNRTVPDRWQIAAPRRRSLFVERGCLQQRPARLRLPSHLPQHRPSAPLPLGPPADAKAVLHHAL